MKLRNMIDSRNPKIYLRIDTNTSLLSSNLDLFVRDSVTFMFISPEISSQRNIIYLNIRLKMVRCFFMCVRFLADFDSTSYWNMIPTQNGIAAIEDLF